MKKSFCALAFVAASMALSGWSSAADTASTTTTTTTISGGTIAEFIPGETVVMQSETSPAPIRYLVTRETTFVDESGAPVAVERVSRGMPVTVQYVREGDQVLASRIIVHREPRMTKARAEALEKYYDALEENSEGRAKTEAKALEEYYDKLADELKD